jgi:hypothetical protein
MKKLATLALIAIALIGADAFAQVVTAAPPPSSLKDAVQQLLVIVIGAVTAAVGTVLTMALHKLQVKWAADANAADQTTAARAAELVGSKVAHFAELIVHGLASGEFAKMLALDLADGKIDPKEFGDLKRVGIEQIRAALGAGGLKDLEDSLGITGDAVDGYLEGQIVKALQKLPFGLGELAGALAGRGLRTATNIGQSKLLDVAKTFAGENGNVAAQIPNPGL